jgi:hypothetical protein
MTMTIITERRPLADIAANLAKRLPGFTVHEEADGRLRDIHLVDPVTGLWVQIQYLSGSNGKRLHVSAWHPVSRELHGYVTHGWPDAATYAVERDLDAVARDIVRRVIEPGRVCLEVHLRSAAEKQATIVKLAQIADDINAMKLRGLAAEAKDHHNVAVRLYAPAHIEGQVDYSRYASLEARVSLGGYVNIDRCSIPLASFTALLALLGALPRNAA